MKKRMVIAFFATSLTAGVSFAADWPVIGTQLYPSAPRMAVEWTGIYFGVNAGYGWAQGSSNTVFGGGAANTALLIPAAATTPLGLGATELGGTSLLGSSSPRGGIAGGQVGVMSEAAEAVNCADLHSLSAGLTNTATLTTRPHDGSTIAQQPTNHTAHTT